MPSADPQRDAIAIRAEIERAREEITDSLLTLRDQVSHNLDWKTWVRAKPAVAVGVAFALGYWIGRRR